MTEIIKKEKIIDKESVYKYIALLNENKLDLMLDKYYSYNIGNYVLNNIKEFSDNEIEEIFKSEKVINTYNANAFITFFEEAIRRGKPLPYIKSNLIKNNKNLKGEEVIYIKYCNMCNDDKQIFLILNVQFNNIKKEILKNNIKNNLIYSDKFKEIIITLDPMSLYEFGYEAEILEKLMDKYYDNFNFKKLKTIIFAINSSLRDKIIDKQLEKLLKENATDKEISENIVNLFFLDYIYQFSLKDKEKCANFISEKMKMQSSFNIFINKFQYHILKDDLNIDKKKIEHIFSEFKDIILSPAIQVIGISEVKEDFTLTSLKESKYKLTQFLNPIKEQLNSEDKQRLIELNINYFLIDKSDSTLSLLRYVEEEELYFNYKEKINSFLEQVKKDRFIDWKQEDQKLFEKKVNILNVIFNKFDLELTLSSKTDKKIKMEKI